ncbi:hypothetical protein [Nocardiopsis coralliicola]
MSEESDLELLRRFEPVLTYTRGELFFPTDVGRYVAACSLWIEEDGQEREVVPAGQLTLDLLAEAEQRWPGRFLHLRFVQESSLRAEARRFRRSTRPVIPKLGRLAAVGVLGRLLDVLVKFSLLIRGAVPGGVAAAAATRYRDRLDDGGATYYARVIREGGYIALQYWFFYAMNDWRSIYGGVNDHEADWEKITVYLAEDPDGGVRPLWLGASSHEYRGDDLRRSWDDPQLHLRGEHPVVFPGAGSHSHQMLPGDYLIQVDPSLLRKVMELWQGIAARLLPNSAGHGRHGIGVPFVDYARGDGVSVGPGGDRSWTPVVIGDATPWVRGFRGLWGRDTRDFFDGERAPSGPRYERDGTVRRSWADPLEWVGLQKVAPDDAAARDHLRAHAAELEKRIGEAGADVEERRERLRRLAAARAVLGRTQHTRDRAAEYADRISEGEEELAEVYRQRAADRDELEAHQAALASGDPVRLGPTEHLRAPHMPFTSGAHRHSRFLSVWATLSTPLLIIALGAVIFLQGTYMIPAMAGVVALFAAVDSAARGKFTSYLTVMAALLIVIGAVVGVIAAFSYNWRIAVLVPIGLVVVVMLYVNVRDLVRK